ncbi:hypothetical protein GCM10010912_59680 [Paenibacillus albidus]|uniref:Gfo/Idh/MocA-like oxidoreductase N-terminal domain-containing protein n=1 Tax=Paenibacillus albidus TaxID=2041023 RepID=A0A917D3G0_9BACL|nr:hypothetical protein GCM10010912_59680 [Paenibacillus albidus]
MHLKSYAKLSARLKIRIAYLVEPNDQNAAFWMSLYQELFPASEKPAWVRVVTAVGDLENYISDLCVPNHIHYSMAAAVSALGCRDIILEKPSVTNMDELAGLSRLKANIFLQENYIHSDVVKSVEKIMHLYNIRVNNMRFVFSKDRTRDSAEGRGFTGHEAPHNFMVELPHSIALAYYFLGQGNCTYAATKNMILCDRILPKHGEGTIIFSHKGVLSSHYSNLQQESRERFITVSGEDIRGVKFKIQGEFAKISDDLIGKVDLYREGQLLHSERMLDDSLTNSLYSILDADSPCNFSFLYASTKHIFEAIQYEEYQEASEKFENQLGRS